MCVALPIEAFASMFFPLNSLSHFSSVLVYYIYFVLAVSLAGNSKFCVSQCEPKTFHLFWLCAKVSCCFFLGNSLSTTSQFQCSAFFHHRKSVIRFVFVICNHAVCISIKWWTKKSNRIKRTPHSYTEPHTHTNTEWTQSEDEASAENAERERGMQIENQRITIFIRVFVCSIGFVSVNLFIFGLMVMSFMFV